MSDSHRYVDTVRVTGEHEGGEHGFDGELGCRFCLSNLRAIARDFRASRETPGAQRDRIVRELRAEADILEWELHTKKTLDLMREAADMLDRAMSFIEKRR